MNRRCGAEGGRLATVTVAVTRGVLVALGPVVLRAAFAQDVPDPGPPSGGGVDLGPLLGGLSGLRDAIGGAIRGGIRQILDALRARNCVPARAGVATDRPCVTTSGGSCAR